MDFSFEQWVMISGGAIIAIGLVAGVVFAVKERRLAKIYPRPKPELKEPVATDGAEEASAVATIASTAGAVAAAASVTSMPSSSVCR